MNRAAKGKAEIKKVEGHLQNGLKAVRTRLGLSQSELAGRAGIARQTIGGIEAALYAPSAAVALRLARALDCRVEELFWLEEESPPTLFVTPSANQANEPAGQGAQERLPQERLLQERLLIGQVSGNWVAHALEGDAAFRTEMMPADAIAVSPRKRARDGRLEVQLLDSLPSLARTVLVAGCSPALSLWTRSAQRFHPGLRPAWIHANSTRALEALARGEVHIAGLHLCDPHSGEENVPFVRAVMGDQAVVLVNFGVWDEGLLLPRGNPQKIRGVADLARENVRFLNREDGAGSRLLLDTLLNQEKLSHHAMTGYSEIARSHQAVAQAVEQGAADAGMGTAAMAQVYGLDFVPLRQVRFDLAVRAENLREEPVSQFFETLNHPSVRLQLQKLGGYNTTQTGEIMARW